MSYNKRKGRINMQKRCMEMNKFEVLEEKALGDIEGGETNNEYQQLKEIKDYIQNLISDIFGRNQ